VRLQILMHVIIICGMGEKTKTLCEKQKLYVKNTHLLQELKDSIQREISNI